MNITANKRIKNGISIVLNTDRDSCIPRLAKYITEKKSLNECVSPIISIFDSYGPLTYKNFHHETNSKIDYSTILYSHSYSFGMCNEVQ